MAPRPSSRTIWYFPSRSVRAEEMPAVVLVRLVLPRRTYPAPDRCRFPSEIDRSTDTPPAENIIKPDGYSAPDAPTSFLAAALTNER